MKSIRILAIGLAALSLVACKDHGKYDYDGNQKWNTNGGVTVSMEEVDLSVQENQGLFKVPVKVTGEPNGMVQVTVEMKEYGEYPAMSNVHYYVTNNVINIDPETKVGSIEITPVDFRGLDPDRTFTVSIVGTKGAEISGNKTTIVQILDKGSSPLYRELAGSWIMSGTRLNFNTEEMDAFVSPVELVCNDPDGRIVTVNKFDYPLSFVYEYDTEEGYGEMVLMAGTDAGNYSGYPLIWSDGQGSMSGPLVNGVWNGNYTSATFGTSDSEFIIWALDEGQPVGYVDIFGGFSLSRMKE